MSTALEKLAHRAGIGDLYWDTLGQRHATGRETRIHLLEAMGLDTSHPQASLVQLNDGDRRRHLPPVVVCLQNQSVTVPVYPPHSVSNKPIAWALSLEQGLVFDGEIRPDHNREQATADAPPCSLELPHPLPLGYHDLVVCFGPHSAACRVIVVPRAGYLPHWLDGGSKAWALNSHLYSVRSEDDWGMGDFGSLASLAEVSLGLGARLIGINPLHALFLDKPEQASPYSPSSRLQLNPLYVNIPQVPEFSAVSARFPDHLTAPLRRSRLIDYVAVSALKQQAFEAMFQALQCGPEIRRQAFHIYQKNQEPEERYFCLHEVLSEMFDGRPWQSWGPAYARPDSPACHRLASEKSERLAYYAYLQWIAETQLAAVAKAGAGDGTVGLYRDLAVGADPNGAEAWIDQDLLVRGVGFGAPPDALAHRGQDWGVPPQNPLVLRDQAYAPFIRLLRANMRYGGALRIDHVMSLQRLFWIPTGDRAPPGAYVSYPLDDLLGLVALESHRNQCLVIGEDLGTVPEGFREKMAEARILSYRVLYFERWPDGLFKRPDAYPRNSVSTPTTHDLPTLRGHWRARDLTTQREIGLIANDEQLTLKLADRQHDRAVLVASLVDRELLPADFPTDADLTDAQLDDLIVAVHRFLGRSSSALMLANLDDLVGENDQLNLPGTVHEYPNWRRRIGVGVKEMSQTQLVRRVVEAIEREMARPGRLELPTS